ncbi:MAG: hypothetical protein HN708_09995 [Candidatus Marinimicrobia bacterium]|nr:hypothetical protein [Candidatus Neomarinimicrobiota bacterium]
MKTQPLDPELESRRLMNEEYESIMSFLHEKYSKTYPNISTEELKQILNEQY